MKKDMSSQCGLKYFEMYDKLNNEHSITKEEFNVWWKENCGQCFFMSEICMYGEE